MVKKVFMLLSVLLLYVTAIAQVTTQPAFIPKGYKGEIIVSFNPKEGNGDMATATQCYAHTGLITSESKNDSDWKYANEKWRGGEEKYKMTKDGDVWKLTIPNMYTYYGCPETEEILQLVFVFNDGPDGELEGKTADWKDIFVPLSDSGLNIKFDIPAANMLVNANESVKFSVSTSNESEISLTINGKTVKTSQGTTLEYTHTFTATGDYICKAEAKSGEEIAETSLSVCVMGKAPEATRPSGLKDGITYHEDDDTKVTLALYAKNLKQEIAQNVFVIGDFNDWTYSSEYQMKKDGTTGHFWLDITNLETGKEYAYQYVVIRADGTKVNISDPFTEKIISENDKYIHSSIYPDSRQYPEAANGPVATFQTAQKEYEWSEATLNFKRPNKDNLIIYEVWVYNFCNAHSFKGMIERLDYIESLGVNAIELMPVCEFEGNESWGYNPTHYFALDKAYGTKDDYKLFIDECHKRGIAVIMDMVFNHCTGLNPMNKLFPLKENPYFNETAPHSYKIFEDFNHEFDLTADHFNRVLKYWQEEYKVDGYRMDVSHGLCGTNCNTIVDVLTNYYENGVKSINKDAYFILEHWPWEDGRGDEERNTLVSKGMMCWTNINNAYSQTAMGYMKDDNLTAATYDGFVTYAESHDEERNFYKASQWGAGDIKSNEEVRNSRIAANVAMSVMLNGPQMLWQFEELGYDYSIDYNGRTGIKPTPEHLGWLKNPTRMGQFKKIAQMIQLRTRIMPAIFSGNPTSCSVGGGKPLRSVIWGDGVNRVFVISNLDPSKTLEYTLPEGNSWYDYFNGSDTEEPAGKTMALAAGEVKVWTATKQPLPDIPDSFEYVKVEENEFVSDCIIYPTISDGTVYISTSQDIRNVEMMSLHGLKTTVACENNSVDISSLPDGMYLMIITFDNHREAYKIYKR